MIPDGLIIEARAKITWGEFPATVCEFLVAHGVPRSEAALQIKQLALERNAAVRKLGIKGICVGVALILSATTFLWFVFGGGHLGYGSTRAGKAAGFLFLAGAYGIHRLIKGIFYLVRPQLDEESLSDVD
ncbi:MAG TPA: hypothetical protein VHB20_03130 [Verrucomicrobiae bacterium]|jgi:hypothetical protein|nr:hypothetical protein [Verrucomicrobiae bacterium]